MKTTSNIVRAAKHQEIRQNRYDVSYFSIHDWFRAIRHNLFIKKRFLSLGNLTVTDINLGAIIWGHAIQEEFNAFTQLIASAEIQGVETVVYRKGYTFKVPYDYLNQSREKSLVLVIEDVEDIGTEGYRQLVSFNNAYARRANVWTVIGISSISPKNIDEELLFELSYSVASHIAFTCDATTADFVSMFYLSSIKQINSDPVLGKVE
jgi:hypothetical protein